MHKLLTPSRAMFAGLWLIASHSNAYAQSAPATPPKPASAEAEDKSRPAKDAKPSPKVEAIEVKSSGEYDERRDDTATKIVVNSAEINKYGDTQVLDVLKRLPGITVQGNAVRMRGLGQGYTQILVDGERPPPGFSLEQLSPTLIERIEIVRAATAEFSTQSIAGTINIVLKKKVSFAQRDLRMNYSQGTYFKSPNVNFVVSDKAGALGYTVSGTAYKHTTRFESTLEEVASDAAGRQILHRFSQTEFNGRGQGWNVGPRLVWNLGEGDSLNFQGFFNSNRGSGNSRFGYDLVEGVPVPVHRNESRNVYSNQFYRSEVNWIKKLADNGKLDVKVSAAQWSNDNDNYTKGFNAADVQNLDRTSVTSSSERTVSTVGKLSKPLVEGHSFVTGWDLGRAKRDQSNYQNDIAIPNVFPMVQAFNADERFEATVDKAAWFAQDEWNVTKAWSLYLGLRWEGIRTTSDGTGFEQSRNTSSVWTPLMQTLYKIPSRPGEQVRFALTRTYKAPNTNSLVRRRFSSVDNTPTSPDFTGNPDLKPELATGIDMAYEKFWGQGSSMSLAASMRRLTDYNRTGLLFIDGRWVSLPINDGTAETKSLEFDTKFPVQSVWKEAPPLDFRFNLARNWSKVDSVPGPNNRLDQQTPLSATLGLDYRMRGGMIVAGGNLSMRQGGEVRISDTQKIFQTAKRDMDVYALWKITPKAQVRLTLSNILKPESREEKTYFDANGENRTLRLSPSKITVRAGVEIKL
jgi:outer membrane receptor for ferrienterochelin and colicins